MEKLGHLGGRDDADESALAAEESVTWGFCAVDCSCHCPLKFHVREGRITRVEPYRARGLKGRPAPVACHRGLALGRLAMSSTRLKWPLRRTGPRGSGQFERIGWDEAIQLATRELERIIREYGNEAVYSNISSGVWTSTSDPFQRLLNLAGGCLRHHNNYSNAQAHAAARQIYGSADGASSLSTIAQAQTLIAFGWNPSVTRQGGIADRYHWPRALRRMREQGGKAYIIDCRKNPSCIDGVEWVPIRPGTDAALASAIAHEVIAQGWADRDFLKRFCVGFDEEGMPAAYRGRRLSYEDYLFGRGYDRVEKTPAWASAITGVPEKKIRELAHSVGTSKPLYVTQGWGPQRRSNGEWTAAAIMALPCLVGQVGLTGTNNGERECGFELVRECLPAPENPVKASIPAFLFTEAIAHPERVTARSGGLHGAERLKTGIKYLINYASNCLTNQHGNINRTHDILADEGACEFILGIDCEMTDSMKYCDLVLPDLYPFELSTQNSSSFDGFACLVTSTPAATERFERKGSYEIAALMAAELGLEEAFTEGLDEEGWCRRKHEELMKEQPGLPGWDEARQAGAVLLGGAAPQTALAKFRNNPDRNPLPTPSGKIELFSAAMLERTQDWQVQADDSLPGWEGRLAPVPAYLPEWDGAESLRPATPLQLCGYHYEGRLHSCWGGLPETKEKWPQILLMNPCDAEPRGIGEGDAVIVSNDRGATRLPARLTDDIVPGVCAMAQGAWHEADMDGDKLDRAGSINVLSGSRPSPLAFGNPQHSMLCQVVRAE